MIAKPDFSYATTSDSNIFTIRSFGTISSRSSNFAFAFVAQTDCGNFRYRNLSSGIYDSNGVKVGSISLPDMQWERVDAADPVLARSMMTSCEIAAKELGINWEWIR